ncbi:terminase small subunit [Variovorax sp. RO1]|uniref:terminase small subunit n=1 Tax=Variovorax sp. RO1 TaxID=2066034 RepID=UPI000C716FA5|nr:terminase small subunit [Variovorax sp. RO1]PLC06395.1 terminase small subunit [Variovorax sp. RO1]
MALTPKQQRFVAEYLIDLNATQAAVRAGYSARTADKIGSQLLGKTRVGEAIADAKKERAERTDINADWVLKRLARDATADLADLYDDHGGLKPVKEWPLVWRTGLVAGVETVQERLGDDPDGAPTFATVRKLKLLDRTKLVELIGKHVDVGAFKEKVEHSGSIATPELKLVLHGTAPSPAAD